MMGFFDDLKNLVGRKASEPIDVQSPESLHLPEIKPFHQYVLKELYTLLINNQASPIYELLKDLYTNLTTPPHPGDFDEMAIVAFIMGKCDSELITNDEFSHFMEDITQKISHYHVKTTTPQNTEGKMLYRSAFTEEFSQHTGGVKKSVRVELPIAPHKTQFFQLKPSISSQSLDKQMVANFTDQENIGEMIAAFIARQLLSPEVVPEVVLVYDNTEERILIASKYLSNVQGNLDEYSKSMLADFGSARHVKIISNTEQKQPGEMKMEELREMQESFADAVALSAILGDHDINPGNMIVTGKEPNRKLARIDFGHAFQHLLRAPSILGGKVQNTQNRIIDFINREYVSGVVPPGDKAKLWRDYPGLVQSEHFKVALGHIAQKSPEAITLGIQNAKLHFREMYMAVSPQLQEHMLKSLIAIVENISTTPSLQILDEADEIIEMAFQQLSHYCLENLRQTKEAYDILTLQFDLAESLREKGKKGALICAKAFQQTHESQDNPNWIKIDSNKPAFVGSIEEYIEYLEESLDLPLVMEDRLVSDGENNDLTTELSSADEDLETALEEEKKTFQTMPPEQFAARINGIENPNDEQLFAILDALKQNDAFPQSLSEYKNIAILFQNLHKTHVKGVLLYFTQNQMVRFYHYLPFSNFFNNLSSERTLQIIQILLDEDQLSLLTPQDFEIVLNLCEITKKTEIIDLFIQNQKGLFRPDMLSFTLQSLSEDNLKFVLNRMPEDKLQQLFNTSLLGEKLQSQLIHAILNSPFDSTPSLPIIFLSALKESGFLLKKLNQLYQVIDHNDCILLTQLIMQNKKNAITTGEDFETVLKKLPTEKKQFLVLEFLKSKEAISLKEFIELLKPLTEETFIITYNKLHDKFHPIKTGEDLFQCLNQFRHHYQCKMIIQSNEREFQKFIPQISTSTTQFAKKLLSNKASKEEKTHMALLACTEAAYTGSDEVFLQSFRYLCAVAGEKRYVTSIGNRFFKHYSSDTASLKNLLQYLTSATDPSNKICARLGITSTSKKQELFDKMQAQVSRLEINRP